MKKLLLGTMLLGLALAFPVPTMARVDINIGISASATHHISGAAGCDTVA